MTRDLLDKKITLTSRSLVAAAAVGASLVASATFGYFRLDAKADAGTAAQTTLKSMQCDIRQLKNFMLYGIKPDPVRDRCD